MKQSVQRKPDLTTRNLFKRDISINPKFKKFIESKLQKGIKLQTDFLEKANIISIKGKDAKISMNFVNSVRNCLNNTT